MEIALFTTLVLLQDADTSGMWWYAMSTITVVLLLLLVARHRAHYASYRHDAYTCYSLAIGTLMLTLHFVGAMHYLSESKCTGKV